MLNEKALREYALNKFSNAKTIDIAQLGSGVHGTGFSLKIRYHDGVENTFVIKDLYPHGLGHDYPSDRAQVFLLALDEYNNLPKHVRAIDVLGVDDDGKIKSVGGSKEYYLLMEHVQGTDYFVDLELMKEKATLDTTDLKKIRAMAEYLVSIHSSKKDNRHLYWRKIRDIIGHGECLMGVFDIYPDGTIPYSDMAEIEKMCIDWRARLKNKSHRLSQIHGDFHPGNIWFKSDDDFILLDRSRGPYGDPADDISAITINYIFYSVMYHSQIVGAYKQAFNVFFEQYLCMSKDAELLDVLAPFYAFRGAVVCNPVFYPKLLPERRAIILRFIKKLLNDNTFDFQTVEKYLEV
ncbi:MAG: aminoglycoside phosphotransferase family protein [Thermodesulfovibrionales bacterium]|nr:aminoglycoside phosphotransferase family protein [Thermodesulfovibrionales bacterium]